MALRKIQSKGELIASPTKPFALSLSKGELKWSESIMSFWVYILCCADNSYYTGHTDNLEQRIGEHQHGLCGGYTAAHLPVELVFSQECATREEAIAAEQQIKGWSRKKKEAMMRGDWTEVSRLAKGAQRDGALVHPSTGSGRTETYSLPPTEKTV